LADFQLPIADCQNNLAEDRKVEIGNRQSAIENTL
jgi:hypothetical protein